MLQSVRPTSLLTLSSHVAANDLSILKRKPSDLLRYMKWTNQTKASYGSITNFVLNERLSWTPKFPVSSSESGPDFDTRSTVPFAQAEDYKVLLNDWPYGIDSNIAHLIVWSKVRLQDQEPDGYLTPESTALVQDFVQRAFLDKLAAAGDGNPEDKVLWFRNWTGLQSVKGLEHVHVLVRDAPKDLIAGWIKHWW